MGLKRMDGLALGSLGVAAMATWAVYSNLPDPIATHFDLSGNPNGWMPRAVGAWFMPVFGLVIWALVRFLPIVLPRKEKLRLGESIGALVAALTALLMLAIHVLILRYALTGATINNALFVILGAFFTVLGAILPRVKRNAFIGIRTAWTLASDENWARTQRVGGYSMVLGGVGIMILGAIGGTLAGAIAIGLLFVSALVPAVYSLVLARRLDS